MSSNHAEISKKIKDLLKDIENHCDDDDCLTCLIKKYECPCGEIVNTKKCYYCKKRICDECEYVANSYALCRDCFKTYY